MEESDKQETAARVVVEPGVQNCQRKISDREPEERSLATQTCTQKFRKMPDAPNRAYEIPFDIFASTSKSSATDRLGSVSVVFRILATLS